MIAWSDPNNQKLSVPSKASLLDAVGRLVLVAPEALSVFGMKGFEREREALEEDSELLQMKKRKKIPYGTKLPVTLTLRERDLIRDETFCYADFARFAVVEGKAIRVDLSLDDIEEIQGYVAAEANHTQNKKLQKELDQLFGKLQLYLDTYDDQDE